MHTIQKFVQSHSATLLLLLISGGFVMLLAELLLINHTEGPQMVGVIASSVGLLLSLVALVTPTTWRNRIALIFLVLSVSGLLGTYKHYEAVTAKQAAGAATTTVDSANQLVAYRRQAAPAGAENQSAVPPLAPLSLAGFALMGAVATMSKRDERAATTAH